ncbi:MAG: hypothetical protein ABIJ28_04200 [Patescibacteria group bacterium]
MPLLPEFLIRIICKKLTYFEWKEAHDKWFKALEKVNAMEKFADRNGFKNLAIVETCSYCKKTKTCFRCPLFYRNICIQEWCRIGNITIGNKRPFWKFVKEMQEMWDYNNSWLEKNFGWAKPLAYCQKILMAINKDKPMK